MSKKDHYNELALKAKAGDGKAVEQIIGEMDLIVKKYVRTYCTLPEEMNEDMVQEGYITIMNCVHSYDPRANDSFMGYVLTKMKYEFMNQSKRHKPAVSLNEEVSTNRGNVERQDLLKWNGRGPEEEFIYDCELMEKERRAKAIKEALRSLQSTERRVIKMMFYDNMSGSHIARKLDVTKQEISRIKISSLKKMKKYCIENSMIVKDN